MESSRRDLLNDMAEHRSISENNQNTQYSFFFKIELCSAILMESTQRDLLNDTAEYRSTLKNNQNTLNSLIFQDRPMFSHINGKHSARSFE